MVGDYPVTKLFKQQAPFEFADVKVPNTAFKRVVRDLEFDLAELAIMTFLLAKVHGKPLRLLPAVVTSRFQHPLLVYNTERNSFSSVKAIEGKKIGQRSYSVTTATWIRGILADQYGVDLSKIRWITFEEPHVAEFRDPPNVQRAPADKNVTDMLLAGEIDAAIVAAPPTDPRLKPLIPDPQAAAAEWRKKFGAIQINHMLVVKENISASQANEFFELMKKSKEAAGNPAANPFGIEENRHNLEVAIDCIYRQNMLPRRPSVDELFKERG
ncbi:MAG TPA: phosphate ABC transporter substrate-binding protein [Burkholderiales bacterium]